MYKWATHKTEFLFSKISHLYYHTFCSICSSDFKICCGGRTAIQSHLKLSQHTLYVEATKKLWKITTYFSCTASNSDVSAIKAKCSFTKLLVEHNLPISAADHADLLF